MACLCLGPKSSGKTSLIAKIQNPNAINYTSHIPPTVGINIFNIKLPNSKTVINKNKRKVHKNHIIIKEVGGTMAPLWKTYFSDVNKIMYVVDTSNLCQISAAGVLLYSILSDNRLQRVKILLILSKMDLSYRQMRNEALLMLQMIKLKTQIPQNITVVEASAITMVGFDKILEWLAF